MKRFVYWFICLLIYLFIPLQSVGAVGEFTADYDLSYVVAPSGQTIVTQNIVLTNRLTNLFAKQYSITIDSENIKNVIAYDRGGLIGTQISQKNGKTEILLTFNEQVVGLGKQLPFTLRFESADIAQKHGSIWEINIPAVADDPDLGNYNVSLDVPAGFGPNAYLSPAPSLARRWTKAQMVKGGIAAAYGNQQVFLLELAYYLENPKITPQITEIALPPDTAFQRVVLTQLSPKPDNVVKDSDGNWLARYTLSPNQKLEVSAQLTINISLNPRPDFKPPESPKEGNEYLKSDRYWETTNPQIATLAQRYRTPQEIYDFVRRTLSYDYKRVEQNPIRKGAAAALDSPKNSVCMEFTDLFIAIARAAGIPAREVVGFAYTTNSKLRPLSLVSDVLHSWPEYYDQVRQIWVPVDPTWANTTGGVNYFDKLDFDHIVFAIRGTSSEYPYPAGFYRKNNKVGKDVKVAFGQLPPTPASPGKPAQAGKLTTTFRLPKTVTAGLPLRGEVIIENTTTTSVSDALILIQASPFAFFVTRQEENIPPLAKINVPIDLTTGSYLTATRGRLAVTVNGETANYFFDVRPMYWVLLPIGVGFGLLLIGIWFVLAKPKTWRRV